VDGPIIDKTVELQCRWLTVLQILLEGGQLADSHGRALVRLLVELARDSFKHTAKQVLAMRK
jgi:hypothetical protein